MPGDRIALRTEPRIEAANAGPASRGEFGSTGGFVNDAVLVEFQRDRVLLDGTPIGPESLADIDESPGGHARPVETLRRHAKDRTRRPDKKVNVPAVIFSDLHSSGRTVRS